MNSDLKRFISNFRDLEKKNVIRTSGPLSDYDLAVSYVVNNLAMVKGIPCVVTPEEVWAHLSVLAPEFAKETEDE